MRGKGTKLGVDERRVGSMSLAVDELSVDEKSVDELSVDGLSPHLTAYPHSKRSSFIQSVCQHARFLYKL